MPTEFTHKRNRDHAKLTEGQVREMRLRYHAGESQASLAAAFGVTESNVRMIVRRKTWTHLDDHD